MFRNKKNKLNSLLLPLLAISAQAAADYKTDIEYTLLQSELTGATPTGAGVNVTQVEASTDPNSPVFAPNPNVGSMAGKSFSYLGATPTVFSGHATGVADRFYGNSLSIAQGITDIYSYEVSQWLSTLNTNSGKAATTTQRIANHSWVGSATNNTNNSTILRQVDRQVERNEYIQVTASGSGSPLLSNGYNTIAVGTTSTSSGFSSTNLDATYSNGRAVTDLVAPAASLSIATPYVSAAAALLVQTGHENPSLSLGSTNISGVGTVYNAERSETIKAALMAGADRQTENTSGYGDITDYASAGHQTNNGLDTRYGAGQLNVYNSYRIIAAGEQNSLEDGGSNNGEIGLVGFDYDASFGGASGSNSTATYSFTAMASESIAASLVWNLKVSNTGAMDTTLNNMGLTLLNVSNNTVVTSSESMIDNTQNIFWQNLIEGHEYQLLVSSLEGTNTFNWDYSLAWQRSVNASPVPVPAAFWLFGTALASLLGFQRKRPID